MGKITENKNYYMEEIEAKIAKDLIIQYHYSHKVVPNSKLHLGVFRKSDNKLCGALQYGTPMNPKSTPQKLVKNSTSQDMYELNRMAMLDEEPKLCESQAIGLSIKYIKRYKPNIKWLLSFSDGKEGNVGIIYQATNWEYHGYRVTDSFFKVDGEYIHNVQVWHKYIENKPDALPKIQELCRHYNNVSRVHTKQYIYIYPIDKNIEIIPPKEKYPKKEEESLFIKEFIYKKNGIILPKKEIIIY